MGLSSAQETVLDELAADIPNGVTWCIFGSTATVLHGLDQDPSDIDFLATEMGAGTIRDAFPHEFVGTSELGISRIDEYRMRGEEVEVVYSERAKAHQDPLVELATVELESTDDRGIPPLPISSLVAAYREMNEHDTAAELEDRFRTGPVRRTSSKRLVPVPSVRSAE